MKTSPRLSISPRARRAIRQRGINAATLRGTGPNGRIIEADVLYAATSITQGGFSNSPLPTNLRSVPGEGPGVRAASGISPMRRAVAAKVTDSFATVPHFYLRSEVDVTLLMQLRQQHFAVSEKHGGIRPTPTDFLLRAMALALRDCPQANSIWQNDTIVQLPNVDVGLVVQVGDGLMVPIIRNADQLSLLDLTRRRTAVVDDVRSGKTSTDLFQGGATSLTNLGKHRVDEFTPIISPPQSSMLAVGRIAERPMAHEGRLSLRHTMHVTLSVDHRVMDGVPAAKYLDCIVELLENPLALLCDIPHGSSL